MVKFKDYPYKRPDMESFKLDFSDHLRAFDQADSAELQSEWLEKLNELRVQFESTAEIAGIRHSINTEDPFYEKENDFFDENLPYYESLVSDFYRSLVGSKFRAALEETWGSQLFVLAEIKLKTFSQEIIEDLQLENRLSSDYTRLTASAKIMFAGKERTLSEMTPFTQSEDRLVRKDASLAVSGFYEAHEDRFDEIFHELVQIRHGMARKLGFTNFVELGYLRMMRSDYDASMVACFRDEVLKHLVPVSSDLKERQRKRLGLDKLTYYDEPLRFSRGNAVPQGDPDWIVNQGKTLFRELSTETNQFFSFMNDHGLLDIESRKGKAPGGYCTYIGTHKSPFIFSNFNGTSGDVDVLTHEAGHAFQIFMSRDHKLPEYWFPTLEACEIHSMSMELLAWPWMDHFFGANEKKYRFDHLSRGLMFIPYGVTVDEFQHFVYENPDCKPSDRKSAWRKIEEKYLPTLNYADNDFLNRGGFWLRQRHIFRSPFYYIDYTLAQVCAFQFWVKSRKDRDKAWEDYLRLCRAGGTASFLNLVDLANLENPFKEGSLKSVMEPICSWLDGVDDSSL